MDVVLSMVGDTITVVSSVELKGPKSASRLYLSHFPLCTPYNWLVGSKHLWPLLRTGKFTLQVKTALQHCKFQFSNRTAVLDVSIC